MSVETVYLPGDAPSATTPNPLTPDRFERLRQLAQTVSNDYGLRGRWFWTGWRGQGRSDVQLATARHGQRFVQIFARAGMQGGQPMFPNLSPADQWPLMTRAMDLACFEVCPEATSPDDPRVYRGTIRGLRNPVAEYMAAADADTVLELLGEIDRLRAALAGAR